MEVTRFGRDTDASVAKIEPFHVAKVAYKYDKAAGIAVAKQCFQRHPNDVVSPILR